MDQIYQQVLHEILNRAGQSAISAFSGVGHDTSIAVPGSPIMHSTPKRAVKRKLNGSGPSGPSGHPGGDSDIDFNMPSANATMGSAGAGSNLQLETVGGKPSYTPEATLKGDYRISEQERTITTQFKVKVSSANTFSADQIYYVPWESIMTHCYENIAAELHDVLEWKPLDAEVKFSEGRAFFDVPPTANAGTNLRDVDHLKLRFLNLSELSALNLHIFEKSADITTWGNLALNDASLISNELPTRAVRMGIAPYGLLPVQYTDAQWTSVDIGDNNFHTINWSHRPHVDSPWRFIQELSNVLYYNVKFRTAGVTDALAPTFELFVPNPHRSISLPRFDYARGFTIMPTFSMRTSSWWTNCLSNVNDVTSSSHSNWHNVMDAAVYDLRRDRFTSNNGAVGRFFDRFNNYIDFHLPQSGMLSGIEGKEGNMVNPYINKPDYFENNVMRPILFVMERINNTAGIQPLYANFTLTMKHRIKVRCWHKDGMNRNEKFNLMAAAAAADNVNFPAAQNIPDLNDLRVPNYYLQVIHDGAIGGSKSCYHSERSTMYVPSYFPIIIPGATEEETNDCC